MYRDNINNKNTKSRRNGSMSKKSRLLRRNKNLILCILCLAVIITSFCVNGIMSQAKDETTVNSYKYYTSIMIKPGDTLSGIASEYMDGHYMSAEDYIKEIEIVNSLNEGEYITAGMNLIIPYYSTEFK